MRKLLWTALLAAAVLFGVQLKLEAQPGPFSAQIQRALASLTGGTTPFSAVTIATGLSTTGNADSVFFTTNQLSGTGKFGITFGAAANAGDGTRGDIAMAMGWNVHGDGGSPLVSGEPSIMWRFENYYRPAATACNTSTHGCQEAHLQWISSANTVYRPIGVQTIDTGETVAIAFSGDTSFLDKTAGTQYFKVSGNVVGIYDGTTILKHNNNQNVLKQLNVAGNHYNSLVYTDSADKVVIGDSAASTGTDGIYMVAGQHLFVRAFQTTAPTCTSNCGTSPSVVGSNFEGRVTMGSTGVPASDFVITFNGTWPATPHCNVWASKTGMAAGKAPIVTATSTTIITVTTNGVAPATSDTYDYRCTSN